MGKRPLSKRTLRAMKRRWQADADSIEQAYPHAADMAEHHDSEHETLRNLWTAIAEIDGLITRDNEPAHD